MALKASKIKPDTKSSGSTQLLGIMMVGQPLCLGVGLQNGAPSFVSVITAVAGIPPLWQAQFLGTDGQTAKYYMGTEDGQYWWNVPSNQPYANCISLVPDRNAASTIIANVAAPELTLSASYQPGGNMGPIGGPQFYFATNLEASAPVYFVAVS